MSHSNDLITAATARLVSLLDAGHDLDKEGSDADKVRLAGIVMASVAKADENVVGDLMRIANRLEAVDGVKDY